VTVDLNIASVLYNDILVKCQLFQCPWCWKFSI
jgi:hypothetical protein